jgi:hypothetical protein
MAAAFVSDVFLSGDYHLNLLPHYSVLSRQLSVNTIPWD